MSGNIYEVIGNLHVHTTYSDGTASYEEVAQAARRAGLDFVVVTDHNVWVDGLEGYYGSVLMLTGEEVHDPRHLPQANHLLAFDVGTEIAPKASDTQELIDEVNRRGGLGFLAHPYERAGGGEAPIPWEDFDLSGYHGLEVWNYMSEFKSLARFKLPAVYYAFFPERGIRGPFRETLRQWDQLLSDGKHLTAIGGADAHGMTYSLGPLSRQLFPYEHLFRCVNTHVLTEGMCNGSPDHDKALIYDGIRAGRTWVGYDLMASTYGFRFHARSGTRQVMIGQELVRTGAAIFEVQVPRGAELCLVCNGQVVTRTSGKMLRYTSAEPGAYRVEAYRRYRFGRRGWIFSSPIYVR